MTKKSSHLWDHLKHSVSVPTIPARENTTHERPGATKIPAAQLETKPLEAPGRIFPRAEKLTVTVYKKDLERLDEIKRHMAALGFRSMTDSEAVRLACRSMRFGDELAVLYREMSGAPSEPSYHCISQTARGSSVQAIQSVRIAKQRRSGSAARLRPHTVRL